MVSFDRAPYDEVMMHGWMLDSKGRKMSKSLGNVVTPEEVIAEYGADALRYYMIMVNAPWEDTAFQKTGPKDAWKVLNTLWNVVNFAAMYMSLDKYEPSEHTLESEKADMRDEGLWMLSWTALVPISWARAHFDESQLSDRLVFNNLSSPWVFLSDLSMPASCFDISVSLMPNRTS